MRNFYLYILTNHSGTLYTGMTHNLVRRLSEHRNKLGGGFTSKYNVHQLVYSEVTPNPIAAIAREKEIKGWKRHKKISLIETLNPDWKDLGKDLIGG